MSKPVGMGVAPPPTISAIDKEFDQMFNDPLFSNNSNLTASHIEMLQKQYNATMRNMAVTGMAGSLGSMGSALGMADMAQQASNTVAAKQKLFARLDITNALRTGFDQLEVIDNPACSQIIVVVIARGKALMFEEERTMFPNDAFVGKMNLLR